MTRPIFSIAFVILLGACSQKRPPSRSLTEFVERIEETIQQNDVDKFVDDPTATLTDDEREFFEFLLGGLRKSGYEIEVIPYFPKLPQSQSPQPDYFLRTLSKERGEDEATYSMFLFIDEAGGEYFKWPDSVGYAKNADYTALTLAIVVRDQNTPGLHKRTQSTESFGVEYGVAPWKYTRCSMDQLAAHLSEQSSLDIENQTGLAGGYNFQIRLCTATGSAITPSSLFATYSFHPSDLRLSLRTLGLDLILKLPDSKN